MPQLNGWKSNFVKPARFRFRSRARAVQSFEMERFFRSVLKKLFLALEVGNAPLDGGSQIF